MGTGQQPWEALAALPAWQVTEIPRPRADLHGRAGRWRDGAADGGARVGVWL